MLKKTPLPHRAEIITRPSLIEAIEDALPVPSPQILEQGKAPLPELPDYVPVDRGLDESLSRVGRLTSEAMAIEYEAAAKAIEAMGEHLLDLQRKMDAEAAMIVTAIDEVHAVAKHYREQGELMFKRIEDCARQTQRVREICMDLRPKVAD